MPPKNQKNADAVHAMKSYGISEVKTKAVLKNLLKLYNNNWQFIIEDGYKVLLEAILDKETEKEKVKCVKKEAPSFDKTEVDELPTTKIYTRRETKQALFDPTSSLETAPSRKANASDDDLLSHSLDEEPFLLRIYSLKHPKEGLIDDSKGVRSKNKEVPSDTEVAELPTKRLCTRNKEKEAMSLFKSCLETTRSRSAHPNDDALFSDSSSEDSLPLSKRLKFRNGGAPSYDQTEVLKLPAKKLYEPNQEKQGSPLSKTCWETTQSRMAHQSDDHMFSDSEESEESQPLFTRARRNLGPVHNVENRNLIFLDTSSDSDGWNSYHDEENLELLEVEPLNVDYIGRVSDLSMVDVPSSPPKGEVETPLICCSSPQYYEKTRFGDAPELKISDPQDVLSRKDDCQGNNCSTPSMSELFVFQNLVKIVPHIPRHMVSSGFEWLKHLQGFTIEDIEKTCEIGKSFNVLQDPQSSKLLKLEAAQNDHSSLGVVKSSVYIDDITRGEERVKISLEYGKNIEDLPAFFYIPENLVYKNAYVKFSLDRISDEDCCAHCYGDCLASPIPCICAIETRGRFAYTPGGLLKEKFLEDCISMKRVPEEHHYFYCKHCPLESSDNNMNSVSCKGHLLRKFIKECWSKCGCNKNCGNRIVQRGITVKLQVFLSPEGKGWGLRTLEDLPRGTFVCEYVGEIVTNTELYVRNLRSSGKKHTYPMLLDAEWSSESVLKDEEALCLDATVYGNVARFINHRCFDASLIEIPVEFETPDHHYYHVAFFTTRNVAAMEELTWDYGIDFYDRNHPVKAFRCLCGSSFCRGRQVEEVQA